ncbi:hypothetical protein WA1_42715 [Scytonema hofmannii PCC 7110]|uniref:Uncharacterized protein n=1 Tax=Scytonema hofmannii PCC 7110 TaxID=128403 RepID=A0A139WVF9_9CYAN|nr:hypothetical protein [Scytonema hofmannii]KYC36422.1 hypothetical protein WA1_42715 [Scytonema hofmannii PCC 7110]
MSIFYHWLQSLPFASSLNYIRSRSASRTRLIARHQKIPNIADDWEDEDAMWEQYVCDKRSFGLRRSDRYTRFMLSL